MTPDRIAADLAALLAGAAWCALAVPHVAAELRDRRSRRNG